MGCTALNQLLIAGCEEVGQSHDVTAKIWLRRTCRAGSALDALGADTLLDRLGHFRVWCGFEPLGRWTGIAVPPICHPDAGGPRVRWLFVAILRTRFVGCLYPLSGKIATKNGYRGRFLLSLLINGLWRF